MRQLSINIPINNVDLKDSHDIGNIENIKGFKIYSTYYSFTVIESSLWREAAISMLAY